MCKCRSADSYYSNLEKTPYKLVFQFYTKKHPYVEKEGFWEDKSYKTLCKIHNCINIAGYFPIIGAISGISRIVIVCSKFNKKESSKKSDLWSSWLKMEIFRGVIEIIGLGILMMIADIYYGIELSCVK